MSIGPSRHSFEYKGILFKSRLEARYAEFFQRLGWKWEYEPLADFRDGPTDRHGWLPDFALVSRGESSPVERIYVEVKPSATDRQYVKVKIEDAGCTDPVLIVGDIREGFHMDVNRYVLGWYLHAGRFSRAVVTLCSTQGHHLCNPATECHRLCGKIDESVLRTSDVSQTLDRYWAEAGNLVGVGSPAPRPSGPQTPVTPDHCRTLEVIPAPQPTSEAATSAPAAVSGPPRSGVPRRWLALGGGALIAGVAVALALVFALGSGDGESVAPPFEDRDCADFSSWAEAQALYEEAGGPVSDPHSLDPDGDGVACERLREAEERAAGQETPAAAASSGGDRDCADFATWEEAQAFYEESGGPASDPHWLDPDEDGVACESLRE